VTQWNMFIAQLLITSGLGPCFPSHCRQFSLPSLVKKQRVISRQWDIPTSSLRSSGVEQTVLVTR